MGIILINTRAIIKINTVYRVKYCRFENFRVIFISRIFCFEIIREVLNSPASIRVGSHLSGLKLSIRLLDSQRSKDVLL